MDKVTILSLKRFMEFRPEVPKQDVVAIRINDSFLPNDNHYLATLSLSFYDVWEYADKIDRRTPEGSNRLTEKDKIVVDEFIEKYSDKYFVVHCNQGISRSSAVGYYILKKLHYIEELNLKKESGLFQPNIEAYGVLTGNPYTKQTAEELKSELRNKE